MHPRDRSFDWATLRLGVPASEQDGFGCGQWAADRHRFGTKLGACLAGFGVAQVIDLGLEHHFKSGALINLFPDWSDERFPLYVYYVSRNYVPAKVRKFIDFIRDSLSTKIGTASKCNPPAGGDAMVIPEATGV